MSYIIVGGNPFRGYTNTMSYTGLHKVALVETYEDARAIYKENYQDCGGLIEVFDTETGERVQV